MRSLRILARGGVEVQVSSAAVVWLTTESVAWFPRWNGNSPSLKVVNGIIQPATQGDSFYIQERYVDVWFLMVGLTVWQVWVSKCKEAFTGKRSSAESLMMIWFNLTSKLQGKFDSLQWSSDASEEARYRFLLKWRVSPMLQMVDGNAKWIY